MAAVALAVIWAGYAVGMWGYCLVRGYCITPANIVSPSFPAKMAAAPASPASGGSQGTPPIPNQAPAPNLPPGVIIPVQPNPSDPLNPSGTPTGGPVAV